MRSETFKSLVSKPVHDFYGRELGKIIGIYVDNLGQLKSVGVDEGHGNLKEYSSTNIVFEEGSLVIVPKWRVEIEKFKNGYQTVLGERGVTLSGGHVQRVSISRAFLKDASIFLFDDCFSSLDSDTEEKLISNLNASFKEKTIIISTHRLSCLRYSDRIIVLEHGKIIQEGNHSKLIQIEGYYKDLYYKQMKE